MSLSFENNKGNPFCFCIKYHNPKPESAIDHAISESLVIQEGIEFLRKHQMSTVNKSTLKSYGNFRDMRRSLSQLMNTQVS
jgi:hypothetical protein